MHDGHSIKQNQPFHRCEKGGLAITNNYDGFHVPFEDADLFGPGAIGAHGGSDMSSVGGTLRVGKLICIITTPQNFAGPRSAVMREDTMPKSLTLLESM